MPRLRLFVDQPLPAPGTDLTLTGGQAHYLLDVMRAPVGGEVVVFNGVDGEWRTQLRERARKSCTLRLGERLRLQAAEPGPSLLFALLKRDCTDLVVEKATELGAASLIPLRTRYTNAGQVNMARLRAIAIEAAEQCGRLTLPSLQDAAPLATIIAGWPPQRPLLAMTPDAARGIPFRDLQPTSLPTRGVGIMPSPGPSPGVIIGPEGGFSAAELDELLALPFVTAVSLGPLILRAETAAIAALSCWQALAGNWTGRAEGAC